MLVLPLELFFNLECFNVIRAVSAIVLAAVIENQVNISEELLSKMVGVMAKLCQYGAEVHRVADMFKVIWNLGWINWLVKEGDIFDS